MELTTLSRTYRSFREVFHPAMVTQSQILTLAVETQLFDKFQTYLFFVFLMLEFHFFLMCQHFLFSNEL